MSVADDLSTPLVNDDLWDDTDFPAKASSIFYHQVPPFQFEWKRAKKLYPNATFIKMDCEVFDVVPGKMGDKWMVSCFEILFLNKSLFRKVVPVNQDINNIDGQFRFCIKWHGKWTDVVVNDKLPTLHNKLVFLQTKHTAQLWPALLEKAYAKLYGSYEASKYACFLDALADFTGGVTESVTLSEIQNPADLCALLKNSTIMTAQYTPPPGKEKVADLEIDTNYKIKEIEKVQTESGFVYVVKLWRPLAPGGYLPRRIIFDLALWISININDRHRMVSSENGIWMTFPDFKSVFTTIEMVHLDEECSPRPSIADKSWLVKTHQGYWRKGVSSGGCKNRLEYFHINPQIEFVITELSTVIINLYQHNIMDPKIIGFSIYRLSKFFKTPVKSDFFKTTKSFYTAEYSNSRQITVRLQLDTGVYLVIPTTFEPREEASFTLRILSNKPMGYVDILDFTPARLKPTPDQFSTETITFLGYEAVFHHLADEHKTIDAFGLEELLEECLLNDYVKSCATIETCKQVVLSLDTKGNGRITLNDFKKLMCSLKKWHFVFKNHAQEQRGVLVAERLRDALEEVGFVIPESALAVLVLKYVRKDGTLRFGDFVSAVLQVNRVFNIYDANYNSFNQPTRIDFSEWLKNVMMC